MKRIFDEIHGNIELDDIAVKILDTPVMQRLRRIRQTSLAFIVYPGATHTRFSHSLGTYQLANKIGSRLVNEGVLSQEELELVKVTSLIHDIGQFPFSHAVEGYYIKKGLSNKDVRAYILHSSLGDEIEDAGIDPKRLRTIFDGNGLMTSIVDGEVDVDRMDYLVRDSRHSGVQLGHIDLDRLIFTVNYREDGISVLDKGMISLENFYIARLHMYQAVYYHKTILGYELLLRSIYSRLVEECETEMRDPSSVVEMISSNSFPYWDDEWLFGALYRCYSENPNSDLGQTIKDFLDRRGPKVIYEEINYDGGSPGNLEEITERLERGGIPRESIYPFEETISIMNKDKIKVISKGKEIGLQSYPSLLNRIPSSLTLRRVYVDREFVKRARELV